MKKLILNLLLLFSVSAYAQFPGHEWASRIITDTIYSNVLNAPREYNVYLPKGYNQNPDKKYPVLYLLHGMSDNKQSWANRGHVKDVMDRLTASKEAVYMISITQNAGGKVQTEWNGDVDMPGWKYETFFFDEFMPTVEKKYRVIGDREHRAVAGLSMGGGGATKYAQHHPDKFVAAYAMSALMDIPEMGAVPPGDSQSKIALLTKAVKDNSCVKYVSQADENRKNQLRSVEWFVDCGDADFPLDRNIEFFKAMKTSGIPLEFRVRDGGQDWEYWNSALYTCLTFVTRSFG